MAAEPVETPRLVQAAYLAEFDPRLAPRVLSWVREPLEAYWLAPRTSPPLTVRKILDWAGEGHDLLMLNTPERPVPLAYGELNVLLERRREYWLGHLIVDPDHRGRGLGRQLTRLLLRRAFHRYNARRVSLVVFPENAAAVASYRAAGMHDDGYELHTFKAYHRRTQLLRMVATSPFE